MTEQLSLLDWKRPDPVFTPGRVRFDGAEVNPAVDNFRLTGQIERVFLLMRDGQWRTLAEIEAVTEDPGASISAQLRNLRKPRFGGYRVEKRRRGEPCDGLFEYRLNTGAATPSESPLA